MNFEPSCLKELNNSDLNTYFSETYPLVLIPKSDDFKYYYCSKVYGGKGEPVYPVLHDAEKNIHKLPLKELVFKLDFPEPGFYNHDDKVIVYEQRMTRQFKKAFNGGSHRLSPLVAMLLMQFPREIRGWVPRSFSWTVGDLNTLFLKKDSSSVETKIKKLLKDKVESIALNRNFAIMKGVESQTPSIWFRKHLVGELVNVDKVRIDSDLFRQEAIDFFTPNEIQVV